jgi:hypothetical protein
MLLTCKTLALAFAIQWNVEVISGIFERQDVVRRGDAVHVQIVPDRGASLAEILRLADDVRLKLKKQHGTPSWERQEEHGDLHVKVRTTQWETPQRTIRVGIPRRVDGKVLVEIAITRRPLPRTDPFWSAE